MDAARIAEVATVKMLFFFIFPPYYDVFFQPTAPYTHKPEVLGPDCAAITASLRFPDVFGFQVLVCKAAL
jgi:hypothetical protein